MEINIQEFNSTVQTGGGDSGLTQPAFERLVAATLDRWRKEQDQQRRAEAERRLSSGPSEYEQ